MEVRMNINIHTKMAAHEAIQQAKSAPDKMLCIGIDIALQTHVARAVLGTNKRIGKGCNFNSTPEGFEKFITWAANLEATHNIDHTFISMEPTATYWRPVYTYLKNALPNCGIFQVDPMAVAYARKMHSSNLSKGDPEDAFLIAELTVNGKCRKPLKRPQLCLTLRELFRNKQHAVKNAIVCERQLRQLLDGLLPGVLKIIPERCKIDVYSVFNKTLDPEKIRSFSLEKWIEINSEFSCPVTKLKKIHKLACTAIKAFDNAGFCIETWPTVWEAYCCAQLQCQNFKEQIEKTAKKHPAYKNLYTVPGLGPITIGGFLAGAGDVEQFSNPGQLEKVFGFDLQRTQSGNREVTPRITKRGYNHARTAMYQAAFASCKLPAWREYYNRKKQSSGCGNKALIALAAKITRTAWKIVISNKQFDITKASSVRHEQLRPCASGFSNIENDREK